MSRCTCLSFRHYCQNSKVLTVLTYRHEWRVANLQIMSSSLGVDTSSLLVHLAGVELTPEARMWLQENLAPAQTVWLKLISREDGVLHCLVRRSQVRWWITKMLLFLCF